MLNYNRRPEMRNHSVVQIRTILLAWLVSAILAVARSTRDDDILWTQLSHGGDFPLVGFGVGNLQHELISDRIAKSLAEDKKTILIDTAHASKNEEKVRDGIAKGVKGRKLSEVHVVTKVWYTHLGYERTKISVKESLEALKGKNIKVHVLIHWPRCNDEIPWMNCIEEEKDLPPEVKKAGRPPHEYKDTAFLDSWAALEDIFLGRVQLGKGLPKIESIGVSNFGLEDFKALEKTMRVTPHILQVRQIFSIFAL